MMHIIYDGISYEVRKARALKALEQVGIANLAKHKPSEMSGGQRQRVSVARAIVNDPEIIFADEPTGNLDSKSGENIMDLFKEINEKGFTVIMVTHNPAEASKARRLIKIKDGAITSDTRSQEQ